MPSKYQTLSEFTMSPFGGKQSVARDKKYDTMYQHYKQNNAVYIKAYTVIEDSWYILVKVPSESQKGLIEYDVVIRFFPETPDIALESHLRNYKIQFFSNSPGFIYQFAYLYYTNGYLIKELYSKADIESISKPPTNANKDMNLTYDKSIYFACKYLTSKQFGKLDKTGAIGTKLPSDKFFMEISSFKDVNTYSSILSEEKKLKREIANAKSIPKKRELYGKYASKKSARASTINDATDNGVRVKNKLGYRLPKAKKTPKRHT
jgi:hypothetical protein